ncbi:PHB depolymerase family esterase [Plantactinospora sp. KBS50]|uniref:extracellular catalytic domain type 1 short-chain-length polyhydroxyalkanoate depolymerase n=1 Tax=Plantactinospora sp. KBS50 TaxID=2024580 RepID=UPI000BAABC1E|nr:PHB depolymerase family esterase [Plantactinospora sp. KBS50]ASW56114.1 feruloyl esterase [Plantactinospora sp. KBS50]
MRRSPSVLARLVRAVLAPVLVATAVLAAPTPAQAASLTQVSGFGSNPGNLAMYAYRPDGLPTGAPAVVLLHGCAQTANDYFSNSGWRKYADLWGFALILPQQNSGNNSTSCFNWYQSGDTTRGQGEALSVKQMTDYARSTWGTAAGRIYVSGLSAGGAMSSVMLATYPDVFAAGSILSGIPYACATSLVAAYSCMNPGVDKTPQQWGDLVRNAYSGYSGSRPRVAIWHGTSDYTVATANATESRDQWTNVLGVSQTPTSTSSLPAGTSLETYGDDVVRLYRISGMGHGTPVDPGSATDQCGTAAAYFLDTICSAYRDALFFGLDGSTGGGGDPEPGTPAAPTGLTVTASTAGSISLSWSAVSGATGYHVYRNGTKATSSPVTGTTYTDSGLTAGTSYSYAVSAVNASGEGAKSSTVSASTTGGSTPVCVTASNYAHVVAGRAYQSLGYAYALGSGQKMGLYNTFYTSTLKQTGPDYWVIGC